MGFTPEKIGRWVRGVNGHGVKPEPRIALDAIDVVWKAGGRTGVTLSGTVMQTMQNVELTITLRE
ncbi:hypothetical protein ACLEUO_00750 [Escherichia coli]